jgi:hypothetical protein
MSSKPWRFKKSKSKKERKKKRMKSQLEKLFNPARRTGKIKNVINLYNNSIVQSYNGD